LVASVVVHSRGGSECSSLRDGRGLSTLSSRLWPCPICKWHSMVGGSNMFEARRQLCV
jgi:hypothetical protein